MIDRKAFAAVVLAVLVLQGCGSSPVAPDPVPEGKLCSVISARYHLTSEQQGELCDCFTDAGAFVACKGE